jgi:hypothetical protein
MTATLETSPLLTLDQGAAYLGIHARTLRRLVGAGKVSTTKQDLGGGRFRYLVERDELERARAAALVKQGGRQGSPARVRQGDNGGAALVAEEAAALREHLARAETEATAARAAQQRAEDLAGWLRGRVEYLERALPAATQAPAPVATSTGPGIAGPARVRPLLWASFLVVGGGAIALLALRLAGLF